MTRFLYALLLVGLLVLIVGSLAYGQQRNTETPFREGMTAIGEAMRYAEHDPPREVWDADVVFPPLCG